ncbi:MAG: Gfo/Idh/MocA family oxidoreductase [Pseudomonadota bacterium]
MLRIGCLGAAKITPTSLIAPVRARNDIEITAIAARDLVRASKFAETHSIRGVETDYGRLIERNDVDMIYNALPPHRHEDLTILALKAGKPVLCEKPIALNAAAAQRMADVADETGTVLMEAFHYRFHPAFQQMKDIVCGGDLGRLRTLKAHFSVEVPDSETELRHLFELGGGALMDLGCYPVHWARTLLDGEAEIVSASAQTGRDQIDLTMEAELIFDGGVRAHIRTSMARGAERAAGLKVEGSDASLIMQNPIAPHRGYRTEIHGAGDPIVVADAPEGGPTTYDYQLGHFLDCITQGAPPILTPSDGVANMVAIDAIYEKAGLKPRGT